MFSFIIDIIILFIITFILILSFKHYLSPTTSNETTLSKTQIKAMDSHSISQKEVTTFVKRTSTETTIEQKGKNPITITQTKTEEIDIPSNLLWSPFVQGLRFAVVEEQGNRKYMENSTNIWDMGHNDNNCHKKMSFSLFDGHLGDAATKFCTQHLPQYVSQFIDDIDKIMDDYNDNNNNNDDEEEEGEEEEEEDDGDDDDDDDDDDDNIAAAIRKAFYKTDHEFEKYAFKNKCDAGAVGVYAYYDYDIKSVSSSSDCIYIANVGDCRAILCSDGKIKQLTVDHNPKNPLEKERCGDCIGDNSDLLSGQISVTRAIGDYSSRYVSDDDDDNDDDDKNIYKHKKLKGLSCNPHIIKHRLNDKDEFLIIACDGLWDVVSNEEAKGECRRSLRKDGDCNKAAQKLIKFAKAKSCQYNFDNEEPQTSDNISVIVIGFANKCKDGSEHIGPKRESLNGGYLGRRRRFGSFRKTSS